MTDFGSEQGWLRPPPGWGRPRATSAQSPAPLPGTWRVRHLVHEPVLSAGQGGCPLSCRRQDVTSCGMEILTPLGCRQRIKISFIVTDSVKKENPVFCLVLSGAWNCPSDWQTGDTRLLCPSDDTAHKPACDPG